MVLEKINIPLYSLSKQKIVNDRGCVLEFYDNYLKYKIKFLSSEPDKEDTGMPWKEIDNDYEFFILKKSISAIEKKWDQTESKWIIVVYVIGMANDINLFFKKQSDCDNCFNSFQNFILSNGC